MTEIEITKGLSYLGIAYGKEYTKIEVQQHYDFLKEYSYETFIEAIKNIIKNSKFLPKINELLEECEKRKVEIKFDVIEFMNKQGYFKDIREYEKANLFMSKGIIPKWFKNDIERYYGIMKKERLGHKETLMIE